MSWSSGRAWVLLAALPVAAACAGDDAHSEGLDGGAGTDGSIADVADVADVAAAADGTLVDAPTASDVPDSARGLPDSGAIIADVKDSQSEPDNPGWGPETMGCPTDTLTIGKWTHAGVPGKSPAGSKLVIDPAAGTAVVTFVSDGKTVEIELTLGAVSTVDLLWAGPFVGLGCPGGADCACQGNSDCHGGLCASAGKESRCVAACSSSFGMSTCPAGSACTSVPLVGGKTATACSPPVSCEPCTSDGYCQRYGIPWVFCVKYGDEGSFCGNQCIDNSDCAVGFHCASAAGLDGKPHEVCVRSGPKPPSTQPGECPCSDHAVAAAVEVTCTAAVDVGGKPWLCDGSRKCTGAGLGACSTAVTAPVGCTPAS